jgi:hypothetical protein
MAASDQIERARFVEPVTGKMQTVEVVAGGPQPLEKIKSMFIAGDQPCDLRSAPLDPPAMRRDNRDRRSLAIHDVHRVVDALGEAPR